MKSKIVIYKSNSGDIKLNVQLEKNTIWLTQAQIAELLGTQRPTITKHLSNIFKSKELQKKSVSSILEHTATDGKRYKTLFYNLDAIVSIGYRVNSFRATQFRIWATKILKQYLVKGFVLNKRRLKEQQKNLKIISDSIALIKSKITSPVLAGQESELFGIIKLYIDSLRILKLYDDGQLEIKRPAKKSKITLDYVTTTTLVNELKSNLLSRHLASDNFGLENSRSLERIIGAINQTFSGRDLYPSIEDKAAHILYFIIKDHPFVDGNKRIGSTLFIYFLSQNNCLFKESGESKINDRALVALALLVAVSNPADKDTIIKLIINLLDK